MTFAKKALFAAPLLISSSLSFAYDDVRRGFYLSGGLGGHSTEFEQQVDNVGSASSDYSGITTAFKVGGYINPKFALYYLREAAWWTVEDYLFSTGITGIGGSFYFNDYSGVYLEMGLGLGDIMATDGYDQNVEVGGAIQFGVGYEATDNVQLGVSFLSTSIPDDYYMDVTWGTYALTAKLELKL